MNSSDPCAPLAEHPLVSVVIPTFNRKVWLRSAIESVLPQDYDNIEIVVVDDGSTDGTRAALSDVLTYPRIRYFYQENTGKPAAARNRGIGEATGSVIAFLDSDDLLLPGSISTRLEVLRAFSQVEFVCTNWRCFSGSDENQTKPSIVTASRFIDHLPGEMIESRNNGLVVFSAPFVYELFNSEFVNASTVMVRRELIDRVGNFNEAMIIGEDYDLWLRIGLRTRMAFVEAPLGLMRNHDNHLTSDELKNFAHDAQVIQRFLERSVPIPRKWRSRLNRRIATFYHAAGMAFLRAEDRRKALQFFGMAWRCRPLSLQTMRDILKCLA